MRDNERTHWVSQVPNPICYCDCLSHLWIPPRSATTAEKAPFSSAICAAIFRHQTVSAQGDQEFGHCHGICSLTSGWPPRFSLEVFTFMPSWPKQSQLQCQCRTGWWQPQPVQLHHEINWFWRQGKNKQSVLIKSNLQSNFPWFNDVTRCGTTWHALTPCLLTFWMWAMRLAQPFSTKWRFSLHAQWQTADFPQNPSKVETKLCTAKCERDHGKSRKDKI